jgi:hypothetical protein
VSANVEGVCLLPLTYFQSTETFYYTKGRFDLSNGITIRKIEAKEIKKIQEQKEYPLNRFDIERTNYTLEKKVSLNDPSVFDNVINEFLTLVLSMRLFKQGAIGYKAAFLLVDGRRYISHDFSLKPRHASIVHLLRMEKGEPFIFPRYSLEEKEFTDLDLFCQIVIKALGSSEKEWPLPVRYFSRMYQDKPIEDILVDCIIAFEALAFKGERRLHGKKTPLALAISMLIGKNSKEREKIKATIKEAYDVRNSVVHGESPLPKTPLEIEFLCWESEKYLRRSIQRLFIEEGTQK